jgi:cellobiose dehydrogenase (acceptor)
MLGKLLLGALPLLGSAVAQFSTIQYTDASGIPFTGIYDAAQDFHLGFVFPTSTTGTEFVGEFVAPISKKWAGISLAGGMVNAPLIMAWPNGNSFVFSTRWAT